LKDNVNVPTARNKVKKEGEKEFNNLPDFALKDLVRFFLAQVLYGELLRQLVLSGRRVKPLGVNHIGDFHPLHRNCRLVRVLLRSTLLLDALRTFFPSLIPAL